MLSIGEVRRQRNLMLDATDHFETISSTTSSVEERNAWISYRQQLREITNLTEFSIENDFWPLPPKRYKLKDGCTTINLPHDYADRF